MSSITRILFSISLILLLVAFPISAEAQSFEFRTDKPLFSIRGGIGPGLTDAFASHAGADLWTRYGLFTVRTAEVREGYSLFPRNKPIERNYDVSMLYGWRISMKTDNPNDSDIVFSTSAGIGKSLFVRRGAFISEGRPFSPNRYERSVESCFGFSYEASLIAVKGKVGGQLGIHGNINSRQSYAGIFAGIVIGRII